MKEIEIKFNEALLKIAKDDKLSAHIKVAHLHRLLAEYDMLYSNELGKMFNEQKYF